MLVTIDLPKEFVRDYKTDKFKDCFERFIADCDYHGLAGNYEVEILKCLEEAFKKSVTDEVVLVEWHDIYWDEFLESYIDEDGECVEDYRWDRHMDEYPNRDETVFVKFDDNTVDIDIWNGYEFEQYDMDKIEVWGRLKGDK